MILQSHLPYDPFQVKALPGVAPLALPDWLVVDDAYAGQMTLRRNLLEERRAEVLQVSDQAHDAACELLDFVIEHLPEGFTCSPATTSVFCPDGIEVSLSYDDPLASLCQILQEDFCILEKAVDAEEHILSGAILCFPASWSLAEKFLKPLIAIHEPVDNYDQNIAKRVQRLFDGIQPDRPLWRFNALFYDDPSLFQPRSVAAPRDIQNPGNAPFFRSERQCLVRLPKSRAMIFSIHTYMLARTSLESLIP